MKVLLTRRSADNTRMAALFAPAGLEAVLLPLIELADTGEVLPEYPYDFSVFTSAAAAEVLASRQEVRLQDLAAYAVGPRTAAQLRQKAYRNVREGPGDAEGLATLIAADFDGHEGARGVYPCGKERARDLAAMLKPSGIALDLAEVYRLKECGVGRDALAAALGSTNGGAVAVFSAESGKRLMAQVGRHGLEDMLAPISLAALSQGVADAFDTDAFGDVHIAARPDAAAMAELLGQMRQSRQS